MFKFNAFTVPAFDPVTITILSLGNLTIGNDCPPPISNYSLYPSVFSYLMLKIGLQSKIECVIEFINELRKRDNNTRLTEDLLDCLS